MTEEYEFQLIKKNAYLRRPRCPFFGEISHLMIKASSSRWDYGDHHLSLYGTVLAMIVMAISLVVLTA